MISSDTLAPKSIIKEKDIQEFFGKPSEVNPLMPILKDIKGLRNLLHRALVEKDEQAYKILDSLATHPVVLIRTMFVEALAQSNPRMIFDSSIWQEKPEKDSDPVVKSQVALTRDLLQQKLNINEGVAHNFRNKLVSAGGFLTRIEKNVYAVTLSKILGINEADFKKAVLLMQKDAFYKPKLELSNNDTLDARRLEVLTQMCADLRDAELKNISIKDLEVAIGKANEQFNRKDVTKNLRQFQLISRSIENEVTEMIYEFQGSRDELVYFIVERFSPKSKEMMRILKELKESFKNDDKITMYLNAVTNEAMFIYDLVNNLGKAVIIEDLKLAKKDIKTLLKSSHDKFIEKNEGRNIAIHLNLVPNAIEAVVSQDFEELITEALKVAYIFESAI